MAAAADSEEVVPGGGLAAVLVGALADGGPGAVSKRLEGLRLALLGTQLLLDLFLLSTRSRRVGL